MAFLEKLNKKRTICFGILFVLVFILLSTPVLAATIDLSWNDPKDDIRCFTEDQLEGFEDEYEDPESPEEILEALREFWTEGELSTGPNCIDMIKIELKEVGLNIKLTITVEGNITDCEKVMIIIGGNCSDGNGIAGIGVYQEGMGGSDNHYVFVDGEGNPLSNGTMDIDGGGVEMEFPASAWGNESCSLYIFMITTCDDDLLCVDIFPNRVVGEPSSSGSGTTDAEWTDPFSDLFANLFYWLVAYWGWILIVSLVIVVILVILVLIWKNKKIKLYQSKKKHIK